MAKIFGAPKSIINKMSTTGMWDNKSNKKEVTELNHQICMYLTGEGIEQEFENQIVKLYTISVHKRHAPVTPKDSWWSK